MTTILLVRHAESTLNADRVVQHPDTPLSERGVWQAGRLGDRLREAGVTHVVSSDYARAEATARAICDATGAPLTVDPVLRERNLGVLRGRPYTEVEGLVFSETHDPEEGERWTDFEARLDRLWTWVGRLHDETPGRLAVVTHGRSAADWPDAPHDPGGDEDSARFPNASVTTHRGPSRPGESGPSPARRTSRGNRRVARRRDSIPECHVRLRD